MGASGAGRALPYPHRLELASVWAADLYASARLLTHARRVVGYRAGCRCGWQGREHRERLAAVVEHSQHVADELELERAP